MRNPRFRNGVWFLMLTVLVVTALWLWLSTPTTAQAGASVKLQAPPLQEQADTLQEASVLSAIAEEAGIAAYVNVGTAIDLETVASQFRTLEIRTANYMLGSLSVPGYNERHDVHVYVHKDGWIMTYYLAGDPAAKMVDIKNYGGGAISTKFEVLLTQLTSAAGVPYAQPIFWDFRSPNANHMMVLGETYDGGDDFTIRLPPTYVFYDRSWASGGTTPGMNLDGAKLSDGFWAEDGVAEGTIAPELLETDISHTFEVNASGKGAVVLIYRVP